MKKAWKRKISVLAWGVALLLAGCVNSEVNSMITDRSNRTADQKQDQAQDQSHTTATTTVMTGKAFMLTAKASHQELAPGVTLPVWTFNNAVPGPEIRVRQGETIKVTLKNELSEPVSIHWHGYPVPNGMDGVPGITQNAVQPGETFTYEFKADVPGTYWYHSHQDSANQVDKGLYGALIVEAKNAPKPDREYTLLLDEWISQAQVNEAHGDMSDMGGMNNMDMSGMDHGNMVMSDSKNEGVAMGHNMNMYDLFTINGKSGPLVEPLKVKKGERVRIRLINAGYLTHKIHLHGHEFQIVATDGQSINHPAVIKDQLLAIAPGERYDIEFTANSPGEWYLECHGEMKGAKGMKALIQYEGSTEKSDQPNESEQLPVVDLASYGTQKTGPFTLDQKYDVEYTMNLNTETRGHETVYTINGKTFPNTEPLNVKEGDLVKVKIVNNSMMDDHPMHLHGHFFQVLSKNGKPLEGSPVFKDTLNVKPGEEYIVAFKADNPGNWMFHCHELHHASAGMVTEVKYAGFQPGFTPDPAANNKPE
ncbi:MAG: multicopper oxidase family protein [Hydrogenibacillus schlegelii]|uniref:Multicopper oxidase family protein n=1 Tax=Hydrogenibacillus schlegelii TaxID=1484 RepID=A0A947CVN2_HYDSH|nr:multicopper oxidase family protein [Hydrogenibacillus schlegelii]